MVALIIIGKLDKFSTFSARRNPLTAYQNPDVLAAIEDQFLHDLTKLAHRHSKDDWVTALEAASEKRRA